ncbi:hypothetical protein VTO42DRAFT_2056 [Malbranchea cinnamomea]
MAPTLVLPNDFYIFTTLRVEPKNDAGWAASQDSSEMHLIFFPYHLARLRDAARTFSLATVSDLLADDETGPKLLREKVEAAIPDKARPWRIRMTIDRQGRIDATAAPIPDAQGLLLTLPRNPSGLSLFEFFSAARTDYKGRIWDVTVDDKPTPKSIFTGHKTSVRGMYSAARERAGLTSLAEPKEVLVWNGDGEVMEGSITTVYFRRKLRQPGDTNGQSGWAWVTPSLSSGCNAGSTRRYALSAGVCVEGTVEVDGLVDGEEFWLSNAVNGFFLGKISLSQKPARP